MSGLFYQETCVKIGIQMTDKLYFRIVPWRNKFVPLVKDKDGLVIRLASARTQQSAIALVRSYGFRHKITMINKDTGKVASGPILLDSLTGQEIEKPKKNDAGSVVEREIEDV